MCVCAATWCGGYAARLCRCTGSYTSNGAHIIGLCSMHGHVFCKKITVNGPSEHVCMQCKIVINILRFNGDIKNYTKYVLVV